VRGFELSSKCDVKFILSACHKTARILRACPMPHLRSANFVKFRRVNSERSKLLQLWDFRAGLARVSLRRLTIFRLVYLGMYFNNVILHTVLKTSVTPARNSTWSFLISYMSFRIINFPCSLWHTFTVLHVIEWYIEADVSLHLPRKTRMSSQS
jgi:hypothetical protein